MKLDRRLPPTLLAAVAVGCGLMAVGAGPLPGAEPTERPPAVREGKAPVLSVRRLPGLLAAAVAERRLEDDLADVIAIAPEPTCLTVAVGDRGVFASSPDLPLTPASTVKLLTARAVLAEVAPGERFTTEVVAGSGPVGGVVEGDLWMVGGGDPVLATRPWIERFPHRQVVATPLEVLADRVREAGVTAVTGAVVGDESRYDTQRYVPTWPSRYIASGQIGPLSALSVDDGFLWPGGGAFRDPAAGAAAVLTRLLQERGIAVAAPPRAGPAPEAAQPVASIDSPTVAEIVGQMLRESDNGTAEMLVKELGLRTAGEGSTEAGTVAVRAHLEGSGLPVAGIRLLDGSGLDPGNRLTCRLLQGVLAEVEPSGPIDAGLPVGGRSGTLSIRFLVDPLTERIRAKTGSLRSVAALAGFAEDPGDPTLTFSYLVNGLAPSADAGPLYDALATVLVEYPDGPDLDVLGPSAYPPQS